VVVPLACAKVNSRPWARPSASFFSPRSVLPAAMPSRTLSSIVSLEAESAMRSG
jgi:hypothetical protein